MTFDSHQIERISFSMCRGVRQTIIADFASFLDAIRLSTPLVSGFALEPRDSC